MMMKQKQSESTENLIDCETGSQISIGELSLIEAPSDIILTQAEREFLLYVQRGDSTSLKRQLELFKNQPQELDRNCLDPLGRSAIIVAIENENLDMMEILLQYGIKPKDALLHAINEDYVEGVEMLLQWEEKKHTQGQPYSWENMSKDTATFTRDITPLILAAHRNHYEILKLLLDRGASLPMPHDIKCGCDECIVSTEEDSLRHSLSRINTYRALSSPSLISLSSKDPILTSFELSAELSRLEGREHEFKVDYISLNKRVRKFATELLDQIRTQSELATMLNYNPDGEPWVEGETHSLDRLKEAIKYSQKTSGNNEGRNLLLFVAHPNFQQLLGAIWYDGLPGFKRKTALSKCLEMAKIARIFPFLSLAYIINPHSEKGKYLKKPFVKFICHCWSYMLFLMLLALASQRIEFLLIEWVGNSWMKEILQDWKTRERGSLPGIVEMLIVIYVFALIWSEIKALWDNGLVEYINDLWNIVDYITNMFFSAWILLRATSWTLVHRDLWLRDLWPWYPREEWHAFDPMIISEGCFGADMIFSFLKLVNVFSVNPHLGPLQISLGRMIFDILKFFCLYTLVLFAFGCGLNQLMWYYAELEMNNCYHLPGGLPDYENHEKSCFIWRRFANLFETSQSLFWASFGLIDLGIFELKGVGSFTRFWALLMFGSYSVINVIVLLNLLIAMMSNSYQLISERSDTEWKFARTKLWLNYFQDGSTVPPPFNIIPTPKFLMKSCCRTTGSEIENGSFKVKSRKSADLNHQHVMRLIVRRFVTEQQRRADEKGVTEDEVNEVKQTISTFRYELIEILKNNGMNTSMAAIEDPTVVGKRGRALERKLMKGFNIGIVDGILNKVLKATSKPSNIFGKLADAIGRKSKTDWNARMLRVSSMVKDQIGLSEKSIRRSRASIKRRKDLERESHLKIINPQNNLESNATIDMHSPTARAACAKFKASKLKMVKEKCELEDTEQPKIEKTNDNDKTGMPEEKLLSDIEIPSQTSSPSQSAEIESSEDVETSALVLVEANDIPEEVIAMKDDSMSLTKFIEKADTGKDTLFISDIKLTKEAEREEVRLPVKPATTSEGIETFPKHNDIVSIMDINGVQVNSLYVEHVRPPKLIIDPTLFLTDNAERIKSHLRSTSPIAKKINPYSLSKEVNVQSKSGFSSSDPVGLTSVTLNNESFIPQNYNFIARDNRSLEIKKSSLKRSVSKIYIVHGNFDAISKYTVSKGENQDLGKIQLTVVKQSANLISVSDHGGETKKDQRKKSINEQREKPINEQRDKPVHENREKPITEQGEKADQNKENTKEDKNEEPFEEPKSKSNKSLQSIGDIKANEAIIKSRIALENEQFKDEMNTNSIKEEITLTGKNTLKGSNNENKYTFDKKPVGEKLAADSTDSSYYEKIERQEIITDVDKKENPSSESAAGAKYLKDEEKEVAPFPEVNKPKLNSNSVGTETSKIESRTPTPKGKSILSGQARTGWL